MSKMAYTTAPATLAAALLLSFAAHAEDAFFTSSGQVSQDPDPMVAGTIPFGPPGVPERVETPPGPQGPLRSDADEQSGDPSVRDTDPLTMNGPWEQLPGNRVSNPAVQQQNQSQP